MESRWLISYTPGPWIVLAGPTAVAAFDSGSEVNDALVSDLWTQVSAGVEMRDLVGRLAQIEYARLPRLAVVFFETAEVEGLRALLRGPVRVLSETGQTIAHGEDVLTWQEVRLAALDRIEIDLGGGPGAALPLVHGGVRAGRLRMAHSSDAPTTRPSAVPVTLPPDAPEPPRPEPSVEAAAPEPVVDDTLPPAAPVDADVEEMEDADTQLMMLPPADPPTEPAAQLAEELPEDPPAIARLRAPDGSSVDVDRPVLIGRAPSDSGFENAQPHLLTVLSPSQDISRTHVLVAPEDDLVVVTDLYSTNGTTVVRPGPQVEREALPSGQSVRVEIGTVIELGDEVAILVDAAH